MENEDQYTLFCQAEVSHSEPPEQRDDKFMSRKKRQVQNTNRSAQKIYICKCALIIEVQLTVAWLF